MSPNSAALLLGNRIHVKKIDLRRNSVDFAG